MHGHNLLMYSQANKTGTCLQPFSTLKMARLAQIRGILTAELHALCLKQLAAVFMPFILVLSSLGHLDHATAHRITICCRSVSVPINLSLSCCMAELSLAPGVAFG